MLLAQAAHSKTIAPEEIERFLLSSEGEEMPRIQITEEDMRRVKEEVAKIATHETIMDEEEDCTDWRWYL